MNARCVPAKALQGFQRLSSGDLQPDLGRRVLRFHGSAEPHGPAARSRPPRGRGGGGTSTGSRAPAPAQAPWAAPRLWPRIPEAVEETIAPQQGGVLRWCAACIVKGGHVPVSLCRYPPPS